MRFLFLAYRDGENPAAIGGDYYLWELAKGVCRKGNAATFVCSAFPGSEEREFVDGVEVVRLKGNGGLFFSVFREYLRRREIFDVVVEEAIGGQRVPFFGGAYVREPLIAVWHQRHYRIFREQYPFPIWCFLTFLELFLARLYHRCLILTPSKGAKNELLKVGFDVGNVSVVYDGVGEIFRGASTDQKRDDVIVCLGKLRRYKRFDHAIFALERVKPVVARPLRLVIAGRVSEFDRGYLEFLQGLVERLGLRGDVEFRFNISESEKMHLLEKARLLIQPSPVEGFSLVVAEANRCGTPVVASDGTPSDVIINGYNGLVYKFGDVNALAVAIIKLLKDNESWAEMSRNSWKFSKQFSWESSTEEFLKVSKYLTSC